MCVCVCAWTGEREFGSCHSCIHIHVHQAHPLVSFQCLPHSYPSFFQAHKPHLPIHDSWTGTRVLVCCQQVRRGTSAACLISALSPLLKVETFLLMYIPIHCIYIRTFTDEGSRKSAKHLTTSVFWLAFSHIPTRPTHCIYVGRYWLYLVLNVKLATKMTPRTKCKKMRF